MKYLNRPKDDREGDTDVLEEVEEEDENESDYKAEPVADVLTTLLKEGMANNSRIRKDSIG